ncbi:MAG TPA: tetratricopeptide repeat protein [Candidatus Limnocylindria bacterium]|jgi:tetratricopeptide (TPR) repeat protein|nr:tetratricopeptide repeat protein [Candidatus Limnocylindria bacterium]
MRISGFIAVSIFLGAWLPIPLPPQDCIPQQENPAPQGASPDLSGLQLTDVRRLELEDAFRRRDYKRAESILLDEAEKDAKSIRSAKVLVLAGGIFFLDGEFQDSVIAWKKAEAIISLDDRSRFTLAMAEIKVNHRDWARPELDKLATTHPQDSLYLYWLARLDYDSQNYAAAITRLQRVVELDPNMMRAYDSLGLCYDYLGQFNEAIKHYNRAVELNRLQSKPSPWPHVDRAISLISLNQLVEAEKNLHEALTYDSRLPQAHYQLGRVLEMQGGYQAAVQSLNQAIELNPSYPEPHYLLGRIYHRLGEDQLSKKEIAQFQELKKASEAQPAAKSSSSLN